MTDTRKWVVMTSDGKYYAGRVRANAIVTDKLDRAVRFDSDKEARSLILRFKLNAMSLVVGGPPIIVRGDA